MRFKILDQYSYQVIAILQSHCENNTTIQGDMSVKQLFHIQKNNEIEHIFSGHLTQQFERCSNGFSGTDKQSFTIEFIKTIFGEFTEL